MSELKDPRVLFAAERTLLAWNRTSLSLIAFGFVVERAGLLMQALAQQPLHPAQPAVTFWLGIAFILLGSLTSFWSSRQYLVVLRSLTPAAFPPGYFARWGIGINLAVSCLGLLLTIALWVLRFG